MKTIERVVSLVAGTVGGKTRVDAYVASNAPGISRSLVGDSHTTIFVDGKEVKKSYQLRSGQAIEIRWTEQCFEGIEPQDIPLNVLYEDDDILVIDKQQGMVVHPAAGNPDGTLVNALVWRYGDAFAQMDSPEVTDDSDDDTVSDSEDDGGQLSPASRPGIVHRLDKDTSGVMVIARNRNAHASLAAQFKEHTTEKYYIAIVKGRMPNRRGRIVTGLKRDPEDRKRFTTCPVDEGRKAETHYLVLRQYAGYALVRIRILTGRTHQIRVHMRSIGHPILGDPIYSRKDSDYPDATLMLHALQLRFDHPATGERMRFCAPMPKRFQDILFSLPMPVVRPGDETRFLD